MTHALGLRAASLATSALMLGLLLLAAMSITTTIRAIIEVGPESIAMTLPPPSSSPPSRSTSTQSQRVEIADSFSGLPPLQEFPIAPTGEPISWAPPGPVLIERPRWAVKPDNLEAYFPARALERGVEGEVALDCLVSTAGALACVVISEAPLDWGFGAAALRIASDHTMIPALRDGIPSEGRYVMNVPFRLAR